MLGIEIEIVEIIDNTSYPGFVKCRFFDVWGMEHIIHEKIPVVTTLNIDQKSTLPQKGFVRCQSLKRWVNAEERKINTVSTELPDHVETIQGLSKFDLFENQIVDL